MLMMLLLRHTAKEKLEKMHQIQNARLDEITKISEQQFTYITQILSSIIEGKRKYTEPDEAAGKKGQNIS